MSGRAPVAPAAMAIGNTESGSMKLRVRLVMLGLGACLAGAAGAGALDPNLPEYVKDSGVSGSLSSVGSDTLANLMTLWAEAFNRLYPSVSIQIQAAGSSTAPPALSEGTATLGPMSRPMKGEELKAFEARHGYPPTAVPVAIDALAIFVHQDNPLRRLTLPQVDAIFSVTRACGYDHGVSTWGDLGVRGELAERAIQTFGRNSVSGTYGYFKEVALCKGDFKKTVNEQPGSASVVQGITKSLNAIGYSGIGYRTASVRYVALAERDGADYVEVNTETVLSGKYPLSRFLFIYVNKDPNGPLAPLEAEFLKMVLSRTGQQIVVKDGYIPLPQAAAAAARAKFEAAP